MTEGSRSRIGLCPVVLHIVCVTGSAQRCLRDLHSDGLCPVLFTGFSGFAFCRVTGSAQWCLRELRSDGLCPVVSRQDTGRRIRNHTADRAGDLAA